MSDETVHLAVSYEHGIDPSAVVGFGLELAAPGLSVKTEERPESGPFAGLEWLVPTALMVIIARPYFESFLSEADKDHYHILKKALVNLGKRFVGKNAPVSMLVYSKGKAHSGTPKYSLVYSVYGEIAPRLRLKLLIEPGLNAEELKLAIDSFVSVLMSIHDGTYQTGEIEGLEGATPIGGTVLVSYNHNKSKLVVINPLPKNEGHDS